MITNKAEEGMIINFPEFKYLKRCRDINGNLWYSEADTKLNVFKPCKKEEANYINESTNNYLVVSANYGGGGTGHGMYDVYPDAWQVKVRELNIDNSYNENGIEIMFNQQTNCYAHIIDQVTVLGKLNKTWI